MFSLIISIIAIALVAALALASIYYGGDAFQEGTAKAEASTIVNQGQQIQAAVTMSEIDEKPVTNLQTDLVAVTPSYLKEVPGVRDENWELTPTNDFLIMQVNSLKICQYVEAAFDGVATAPTGMPAPGSEQAFGCVVGALTVDAETAWTAYYKL